jgi:hypothetical protein
MTAEKKIYIFVVGRMGKILLLKTDEFDKLI